MYVVIRFHKDLVRFFVRREEAIEFLEKETALEKEDELVHWRMFRLTLDNEEKIPWFLIRKKSAYRKIEFPVLPTTEEGDKLIDELLKEGAKGGKCVRLSKSKSPLQRRTELIDELTKKDLEEANIELRSGYHQNKKKEELLKPLSKEEYEKVPIPTSEQIRKALDKGKERLEKSIKEMSKKKDDWPKVMKMKRICNCPHCFGCGNG